MPEKKRRGRAKEMLLSWVLKTSDEDMDYREAGTKAGKMVSMENKKNLSNSGNQYISRKCFSIQLDFEKFVLSQTTSSSSSSSG